MIDLLHTKYEYVDKDDFYDSACIQVDSYVCSAAGWEWTRFATKEVYMGLWFFLNKVGVNKG